MNIGSVPHVCHDGLDVLCLKRRRFKVWDDVFVFTVVVVVVHGDCSVIVSFNTLICGGRDYCSSQASGHLHSDRLWLEN